MNVDAIIARAAPPPARVDSATFEPAATDSDSLARRRERLVEAFGSPAKLAAHAEALGMTAGAWFERFRDVRLVGADPDWGRAFRSMVERLSDGPQPFAELRRWATAEARGMWPAELPRGVDALEGPLDYLASRLGTVLQSTYYLEGRLGVPSDWNSRFERSPALAYALGRVVVDWLADLDQVLACAAADRMALARAFFRGDDPGALTRIEPGLGDPHAGGRSVAILHFERGSAVLKPKDLRIASTVGVIAKQIAGDSLAPPAMLLRDGYAWETLYRTSPISGRSEADEFFGALGGWLALLQALGASDFWFDNLIADGSVPRFIDFETAVQPPARWPRGLRPLSGDAAVRLAAAPIAAGILPLLFPTRDGEEPTDIGCLTRPGEHRTPLPDLVGGGLLSWSEQRFAPRYAGGTTADAADHFDAFEEGYLRVARTLAVPECQGRIVEHLHRIADAPVRIIQIDTWTCYRAIHRSLAPCFLSDAVWREIALHAVIPTPEEMLGELREAAVRDLRRLDVPLFQTHLGSRDLLDVHREFRRVCFPQDAISGAKDRLLALADVGEDERRAWLRSGFGLRRGNPAWRQPTKARLPHASDGDLLAWADEIASLVVRGAVADECGTPTWVGLVHDVFTGWRVLGPLGFDVLSGRSGLALALLELASPLNRTDLSALAQETLVGAGRDFVDFRSFSLRFGAGYAVGAGGLVATLAQVPELKPNALETYGAAASAEVWMHSGDDFVSGLAGWRKAALAVGETSPARHGTGRPYAPSARARLAHWLTPEAAEEPCSDALTAARMRRDYECHGSWFARQWLDDRHNLSGIDGLPALAVCFARLAQRGKLALAAESD